MALQDFVEKVPLANPQTARASIGTRCNELDPIRLRSMSPRPAYYAIRNFGHGHHLSRGQHQAATATEKIGIQRQIDQIPAYRSTRPSPSTLDTFRLLDLGIWQAVLSGWWSILVDIRRPSDGLTAWRRPGPRSATDARTRCAVQEHRQPGCRFLPRAAKEGDPPSRRRRPTHREPGLPPAGQGGAPNALNDLDQLGGGLAGLPWVGGDGGLPLEGPPTLLAPPSMASQPVADAAPAGGKSPTPGKRDGRRTAGYRSRLACSWRPGKYARDGGGSCATRPRRAYDNQWLRFHQSASAAAAIRSPATNAAIRAQRWAWAAPRWCPQVGSEPVRTPPNWSHNTSIVATEPLGVADTKFDASSGPLRRNIHIGKVARLSASAITVTIAPVITTSTVATTVTTSPTMKASRRKNAVTIQICRTSDCVSSRCSVHIGR
jgi:hypothetical protein